NEAHPDPLIRKSCDIFRARRFSKITNVLSAKPWVCRSISEGTIPGRRRIMEKRIATPLPQFWLVSTRLAPHAYGLKPTHLENRTRPSAPLPGLRDSPKVLCRCM